MKFRNLLIAWSALCGIACVLVITLWVRSYWRMDQFIHPLSAPNYVACTSIQGQLTFGMSNDPPLSQAFGQDWTRNGFSVTDWDKEHSTPFPCFPSALPGHFWSLSIRTLRFSNNQYPSSNLRGATTYEVIVPYWLLFVLAAMPGVVPRIKWRFSLRILLIATTVIAVALGLIVWLSR